MKKILIATLILLMPCSACFAEIQDVAAPLNASNQPPNQDSAETDNIFTNDPQSSSELQGYLEYDEVPDETIYLEEQPESSQNTIYLKSAGHSGPNLKSPTKFTATSLIPTGTKQIPMSTRNSLDSASKFSTQEYSIRPVSTSYSTKAGGFSFGTTYNSGIDSAQANYSTGIYTKYDGKYFSYTTAYSKSTNSSYDSYSDKIFFAPELKLTKRLSILDVIQTDTMQVNKKHELVLRYSPPIKKHADDVQFELGAGQSFHDNNYINSSVRFSTRFKL